MMHFLWPVRWKPRSHHYPLREASRGEGRLGYSTRDGASPIDHREYNSRTRLFPVVRLLAMAFVQFSGVTYHDPKLAYDSYVLYTGADGVTRLIDLKGVVRKQWPYAGVPARIIDPALNAGRIGDIGVQLTQLDESPGGIYGNRTVGQLSWTGEKLWEWGTEAPGGAARQNHDWELLQNGNRLILVAIPREVPALGPRIVVDQGIYEVATRRANRLGMEGR